MIKNFLYSLFFHTIFIFIIYINFKIITNNQIIDINRSISVGVAEASLFKNKMVKINDKQNIKAKDIIKKVKKNNKEKSLIKEKVIENASNNIEKNSNISKVDTIKNDAQESLKEESKDQTNEASKASELTKKENENSVKSEINAKNIENLELSHREKFNISSQLKSCFNRFSNNYKFDITIALKVSVSKDGSIEYNKDDFIDYNRISEDQNYKNAVNSVIEALDFCSPLRNMPADKYEIWNEFSINFDFK